MRIENVVIENINSLAGRFEIDLCDPAYAGGLFAIVGPSGAGKTTVLDAICLALYGKTPRVSTVSDTQDELMNKNEPFCKAQVVFTARGRRYKALFVHERARGGKPYRAAKRELHMQGADQSWSVIASRIREAEEKIEEVTGLDFGRFTRSIMLAQFRFAEFLQAGSNERAAILEQITDMDIYRRISVAVYERAKRQRLALENTRVRIGGVTVLSGAQETALLGERKRLAALIKAHGALAAALGESAAGARRLDGLQKQHAQYAQAQAALDAAAQTAQDKLGAAARREQAGQAAQQQLLLTLKEVRAIDLRIQAQQNEAARIDRELKEDDAQTREHKSVILEVFRRYFPDAPTGDYKKLYDSAELGEELKRNAADELETAKKQAAAIRAEMSKALAGRDEAYWRRRSQALRIAVPISEARDVMQKEQAELAAQQTLYGQLAAQSADIADALRQAQERFDHARLEQRFGDERRRLKDGQPCPLCGAAQHPYADKAGAPGLFDAAKREYDQAAERRKQHDGRVAETQARIAALQKQTGARAQAIAAQAAALETLGGAEQGDTETLLGLLAEAENVLVALGAFQTRLSAAGENVTALTARFFSVDKDVELTLARRQMIGGIAQRAQRRERDKQAARAACDALMAQRAALFGDKNADAEEEAMGARLKEAQADREACRAAAEQAQNRAQGGRADAARTRQEIALATETLGSAYAAAREQAAAARTVPGDEGAAERLAAFAQAAAQLGEAPEPDALDRAAQAAARLVSEEDARRGVIGKILDDNAQSRGRLAELQSEEDAQAKALQKWERLSALIGSADGARFSRMAQSITFDALLSHANTVLRRLSDRYILVRGEAGAAKPLELAVADTYQAGEVRPVVNLSGGESFIVSLALALGLSEMSAGAARIDSLFIDEGFASLDEGYMEAALQTLCALGTREGKLIGVISHVEALKERIDVQIEVTRLSGGRATLRGPGVTAALK